VLHNGHPLYRYAGEPGDTNGQRVTAFGAAWFAVSGAGTGRLASRIQAGRRQHLLTMVSPRPHRVIVVGGGFDVDRRRLDVRQVVGEGVTRSVESDTPIVAGGSHYSYFGHDEWRRGREVNSLESAVAVRARLLAAFEAAETTRRAAVPG
jgi:hypothetical protein